MTTSQKIRFFFKVIFYLPGTFLHEFSHLLGFWIMGFNNLKFSLIPKNILSSFEITMGSATASLSENQSRIRLILPAISPKFFLFPLYYLLNYFGVLHIEMYSNAVDISIFFKELDFLNPYTYLLLYLSMQLFWASSLSFQDWKMFFSGIFSFWGIIMIGLLLAIAFSLYRQF